LIEYVKSCTLAEEAFLPPTFDDLLRFGDKLCSMFGEVLVGSDDKVAVGELRGPQALGLKLALGLLDRPLSGKGVGGEGDACAELG
jgi:hypothetical protein